MKTAHNQENIQATNLLIDDQPIKIDNSFIPNRIHPTTKSPLNLPDPKDLFSQNPKQNLTQKMSPVTNVTRKDIRPVFAKSIQNFMSFK